MAISAPRSPPQRKANPISIAPKANMLTPAGRRNVIVAETGAVIAEAAADAVVVVDAEAATAGIAAVVVVAVIATKLPHRRNPCRYPSRYCSQDSFSIPRGSGHEGF